jgi:hypothetical protein
MRSAIILMNAVLCFFSAYGTWIKDPKSVYDKWIPAVQSGLGTVSEMMQ